MNKSVKDMLRPEVIMFIYNNQGLLYKEECSLIDIKKMNDKALYEVANTLEIMINNEK